MSTNYTVLDMLLDDIFLFLYVTHFLLTISIHTIFTICGTTIQAKASNKGASLSFFFFLSLAITKAGKKLSVSTANPNRYVAPRNTDAISFSSSSYILLNWCRALFFFLLGVASHLRFFIRFIFLQ